MHPVNGGDGRPPLPESATDIHTNYLTIVWCKAVVAWQYNGKMLNLQSRGRRFESRSGLCQVVTQPGRVTVCGQVNHLNITNTNVNSALHSFGISKSSTTGLLG